MVAAYVRMQTPSPLRGTQSLLNVVGLPEPTRLLAPSLTNHLFADDLQFRIFDERFFAQQNHAMVTASIQNIESVRIAPVAEATKRCDGQTILKPGFLKTSKVSSGELQSQLASICLAHSTDADVAQAASVRNLACSPSVRHMNRKSSEPATRAITRNDVKTCKNQPMRAYPSSPSFRESFMPFTRASPASKLSATLWVALILPPPFAHAPVTLRQPLLRPPNSAVSG